MIPSYFDFSPIGKRRLAMTLPPETRKAIELAKAFHDTYEELAPKFGYETRSDTRKFDPDSPNGKLMIEVCALVIRQCLEEINAQEAKLNACVEALDFATLALDDWMRTHAPEECDKDEVARTNSRIWTRGGTLAYIAEVRQAIRAVLGRGK